jgi:ATP-dependent Clp protease protease subunit
MIKKLLEKLTSESDSQQQLLVVDPSVLSGPPEPDLRTIGMFCDIQEEKVAEVIHAMLYLNETNRLQPDKPPRPIEFYLSTYGGSADDMFGLYDVMRLIRQETEIHTFGVGKVMSAGVLLLAAGTKGKRRIAQNCRIMLHSVAAGNHGNLHDLTNELEAISDLQKMYARCLVKETEMTKSQLKKMLERKVNVYLSAEEAVKLGIADVIV